MSREAIDSDEAVEVESVGYANVSVSGPDSSRIQPVTSTPADDYQAIQAIIRSRNAARLERLIHGLEPQVDGTYGPVNPRLVELYMKAMSELGKLYRVFDPVKPPPPQEDPETVAAVLRQEAARQLEELRGRIS